MTDVTKAMAPKSDQQNADDFLAGPKTIRITEVKVANAEQPVWVYFDGCDNKPWKPSKTSLRCLASIWGADSSKWIGLHCTLYNDPEVTWGGMKVGGIRVSHMEGLDAPRTLMLTKTRGKKGATVIKPLVKEKRPATPAPEPTPEPAAEIDIEKLKLDVDAARTMSPEEKKEWWSGLSEAEKTAVKGMAAH